ncbi:MAG: glycosyltransferase family 4 protein, partial [Candidatus Accumulibacter sp.]|nr:glycosyltransferase family 4 protein [Accumulibacter sp.]
IEAMPQILAECPEAHYLVVGDGDYRSELERRVNANGLQGQVSFAGSVSLADLPRYYQSCDLFVMPNREMPDGDTEGFGLVFLEANACRKAVIGGRAGGAVEAVRDGQNGLLVDGNDPREIASAVIRLLKDDALRESLAEWGLEYARASSWQVQTERFMDLCQEIVDRRVNS